MLKQVALLLCLCLFMLVSCAQKEEPESLDLFTPTAVVQASETPAFNPTDEPLATPTLTITPTIPNISVSNQILADDGQLMFASVVSNQPGWLVVYAWENEALGDVLGYTAVEAGINTDLSVTIDPLQATPTLAAILHVDEGQLAEFEFPDGPDMPVEYELGKIAATFSPEFQLSMPIITVSDQEIVEDGLVKIESVLTSAPGWLVLHADEDGQLGPYLGSTLLQPGLNEALTVHIPWRQGTPVLHAVIYEDNGREQLLDLPGEDVPLLINNSPVVETFSVTYPPDLFVLDQPIVEGKFQVERVYSNGPGWLVVYFDDEGEPGLIIGHAPLADGVNEQVEVEVLETAVTNPLYIRLHEDTEPGDDFDFPRVDPPIIYEGRQLRPYSFNSGPGNYVIVRDQVIDSADETAQVTIPTAVVAAPGWLVIHAENNGLRGDVLGFAQLDIGLNRNIVVEIPTEEATELLYAVLYLDGGEIGEFEFPNGEDVPLQRNRRILEIPFHLLHEVEDETE